jgi:hypothetical protein
VTSVFPVNEIPAGIKKSRPNPATLDWERILGIVFDLITHFIWGFSLVVNSVGDPDPVGSGPFWRIRIRKFRPDLDSGSGSDPPKGAYY